MKRILKVLGWTVVALVSLVVMLAVSLYIPPVQRWAVGKLTDYLSEDPGLEVRVGSVHLAFPLDLSLGQVHVVKDSLGTINIDQAVADVELCQLFHRTVRVEELSLSGCVADLCILPSEKEDTTQTVLPDWLIDLDHVSISQSRVSLLMPASDMSVYAAIRQADFSAGDLSLAPGIYRLGTTSLAADSIAYDILSAPKTEGLDVNHLGLSDVQLQLDGLCFEQQASALRTKLRRLAFREKSGLQLDQLAMDLALDANHLTVSGLDLKTPASSVAGSADLDWNAFDSINPGRFVTDLQASLGSQDVRILAAPYLPKDLSACYPEQPLNLDLHADGNLDSLRLERCILDMPTIFDLRAEGALQHIADSLNRGADLRWDLTTMDLRCLNRYLGLSSVRIPKMVVHADTRLRRASQLTADALLTEGRGRAHLKGNLDLSRMAYDGNLRIRDLQIHDFLPHDSIYRLTANARFSGCGTDMLSPRTRLKMQAAIDHLEYASWALDSIAADCRLEKGKLAADLSSRNDLLCLHGCADAEIADRKLSQAAFSLDLSRIDFHALGFTAKPFSASMVMHLDGASDFLQTHRLAGSLEAIELVTADSTYHPLDLNVDANLTPDLIRMSANAGDLRLALSSDHGLDSLMARYDNLLGEIGRQIDSLNIRQDTLRTLLPHLKVELDCGQRNPISNILRHLSGYTFRDLSLHLLSSPETGLSGNGHLNSLNTGAILLDTIRWNLVQHPDGIALDARVANGARNRMVTFQSQAHAALTSTGVGANLLFFDAKGQKSMDFGLNVDLLADGIRAHFTPLNPIIAYRRFTLNADNFITLTRSGHLDALVDLLADDGTGLKLYSTPNEDAKQDISLGVNHFNVGELTRVIPFMPAIDGFLEGDVHYMQADSTMTVAADMLVRGMAYNAVPLGNIGLNATYFPNADGSHYVDGVVTQNGREILLANGSYAERSGKGYMEGEASFQRTPFALLNAFMPDGPAALCGYAWGDLAVSGTTDSPILNGDLRTDSLHVKAERYNIDLQFPDDAITIHDSRLNLDRIEAYAAGKTPLVLDGNIDFSDLDDVQLTINIDAKRYQLINAPKRQGALAYGKVFVDFLGRVWGTTNDLKMRGKLSVLGDTDVSCVLTDTPLAANDPLADIVTFCDFTDTIPADPTQVQRQMVDMQLSISVEQAAQVHCFLSDSGSDYIDLQGGGDLTMTYDTQNDIQLWGRYIILRGTMRYSLMAIPLNDFRIAPDSYVEFQGKMLNPRLNIRASERVKSSVTENSMPRNVAFDVGLALSKTLEDMGLEFTLEAPEDLTIQNELTSMTPEERGRVAVTMLITGMYVTDRGGSGGGYSYTNTLNAYLQSTVNSIVGEALNTVDVNIGIANGTSETGSTTTDYSFSFAKRFWGNRISVIVGGKVSSGRNAVNSGQTIIDNISVEYRLDNSASRYVRLFYDRNYESLLEGQITEMGGGVVFRKKTDRLKDLFIFRRQQRPQLIPAKQEIPRDSL